MDNLTLHNKKWQDVIYDIPANSIDLVALDPPYNVNFAYNEYKDNLTFQEYLEQQCDLIKQCCRILKEGGSLWYLNYPEFNSFIYVYLFSNEPFGVVPVDMITWVYNPHTGGKELRKGHRTWIWSAKKSPKKADFNGEYRNPTDKRIVKKIELGQKPKAVDWWHFEQVKNVSKEKTEHPCQVPEAMMDKIILGCTDEEDVVFDPYLGSGTTGVSAIKNNRKFIGSEMNEKYFNIAVERIKTGKSPKENKKNSFSPTSFLETI